MAGKIIGHRTVVMELSVFNRVEEQWFHIARYFRHALHSTKGWRPAGTNKIVTKIPASNAITKVRTTSKFERIT